MLKEIEDRWRSEDPRDRYIGGIGKVAVELGSAGALAILLYVPIFLVHYFTGAFSSLTTPTAILSFIGSVAGFIGYHIFCKIIVRGESELESQMTSSESKEETKTEDDESTDESEDSDPTPAPEETERELV